MLYDFMDEYDQQYYLLEKIEEIIRKFNFDEDIGLSSYHVDMWRAVFFNNVKLEYIENREKYQREFNGHDYIYRVIYDCEELREFQRKIKYGYFNEESYEFFNRNLQPILDHIEIKFEMIFGTNSLFMSFDEFKCDYGEWFPYMNIYDLLDIKMNSLFRHFSDEEIQKSVKALKYKTEFLRSAYWVWVRHQKLICFGNKCEFCGARKKLQVHHRRYDNHGLEHKFEVMYKDLMITCEDCHGKIHGYKLTEPS